MENENLRTNFSFEIERTSDSTGRRSSDASRGKFIPIIPMAVSATETRQAYIEPYTTPTSPANHNHKSSLTSSPRRPKKHLDPPKFVRFASLHGRRNIDSTIIAEEDENYRGSDGEGQPFMNGQVEEDLYHDVVHQEPLIAKTVPVIDGPATYHAATLAIPMEGAPRRASHETSSEHDVFFTPHRGTTPSVVETTTQPPQKLQQAQIPPFAQEASFHGLSESNLGIDFKDFVIPPPTTNPSGADTATLLDGPNKDRKWTPEVMAA